MKIHSQESYHICPYPECGRRYVHEYKLKNHIMSHHEKVSSSPMIYNKFHILTSGQYLLIGRNLLLSKKKKSIFEFSKMHLKALCYKVAQLLLVSYVLNLLSNLNGYQILLKLSLVHINSEVIR